MKTILCVFLDAENATSWQFRDPEIAKAIAWQFIGPETGLYFF